MPPDSGVDMLMISYAIICKHSLTKFLDHLNSVKMNIIRFTYEVEDNMALPFLDTLVTCSTEGSLETRVYRKQTHTDQLLHFRTIIQGFLRLPNPYLTFYNIHTLFVNRNGSFLSSAIGITLVVKVRF